MSRIDEIITGWSNYFFQKPEIEALARERLAVCVECEYYNVLNVCTRCFCPGAGMARSPEHRCPVNKWPDGWGTTPQQIVPELHPMPVAPRIFVDEQLGGYIAEEEILRVVNEAKQSNFTFKSEEEFERYRYLSSLL